VDYGEIADAALEGHGIPALESMSDDQLVQLLSEFEERVPEVSDDFSQTRGYGFVDIIRAELAARR
jgi:hypothetical protein